MQQFKTTEDYLAINENLDPVQLSRFLSETNNTIGKLDSQLIKKTNLRGPDFAWHKEDVPAVIEDAKNKGIAIGGWQAQYRFPDGICDLYWIYFANEFRDISETWSDYVQRCADKALESFTKTVSTVDIKKAVMDFQNVKTKTDSEKEKIDDYLYFEVYLRAKENEKYIRKEDETLLKEKKPFDLE